MVVADMLQDESWMSLEMGVLESYGEGDLLDEEPSIFRKSIGGGFLLGPGLLLKGTGGGIRVSLLLGWRDTGEGMVRFG